jgi:hypothetical protein
MGKSECHASQHIPWSSMSYAQQGDIFQWAEGSDSCRRVIGWYQQDHVDESDLVQLVELEFHLYYLECGHIPSEIHKLYAIIDDQSNRSLASPAFFDMFNILDKPENYTLSTCSGIIATSGSCRWKWFSTTCGVGISSLLSGMWSHSINVGRLKWMSRCTDSTTNLPRLPDVAIIPEQVESV